ncbi:MAG: hypothetical protein J4432_03960 [DPANN group archaeon]|nr:hypothetical protein [DPANN group archaeon]
MPDDINLLNYKPTTKTWKTLFNNENVEVRVVYPKDIPISFVIQDNLQSGKAIKGAESDKTRAAINITDKALVEADIGYFEKGLWQKGKSLK